MQLVSYNCVWDDLLDIFPQLELLIRLLSLLALEWTVNTVESENVMQ